MPVYKLQDEADNGLLSGHHSVCVLSLLTGVIVFCSFYLVSPAVHGATTLFVVQTLYCFANKALKACRLISFAYESSLMNISCLAIALGLRTSPYGTLHFAGACIRRSRTMHFPEGDKKILIKGVFLFVFNNKAMVFMRNGRSVCNPPKHLGQKT